jgi:hypothetical protein
MLPPLLSGGGGVGGEGRVATHKHGPDVKRVTNNYSSGLQAGRLGFYGSILGAGWEFFS